MNKKTHIPEIRFKNYRDKWEEKTLKDLSNSIEYGLNSSATYYDGVHKYIRITDIDDNSRKFISEKVTSPDIEFTPELENFKLQKNDLLFARTGASVGKTYLYEEKDGEMYYAGFLIRARIKEDVSADFIFQQTLTEKYKQFIAIASQRSGQPGVNGKEYGDWKLSAPSFQEQSAIGSLFRTLDDLLASYQGNLANYQSLKATMLSKMFPKAGQTVPEIRLDGFEGEWELLEINDLADDFQSGGTPKTNVQEYWDGDIPWIQSSDLETNCLFEIKVQKSISEKGLKNSSAKIIPKDSIAVVTRVGVGKLAVMRHEYATSQDFLSLSNLKSNIEFTAYLLYRLLQKEVTQLQGTSIKGITKVELLSKKVLIPSLSEQQAIGAYFSNLDSLISAHQEKISQLETLKKKLLQDMFI
ncbi:MULTISPECIES: restriction endonuclease subunit S [unclassified Streptococcus]|uniref:restriction endonuclease subunit S n=1 Tax=Streptococcus TaxID=1301 RepID=UPI0020C8FC9C|nr:restriction endonuclease subunit S [Streptococcus sp. CF8_St5-12]MCP8980955.1 restriction endonuclease subunit S [Streptococcus sp. CF8_St5-16]MCP8982804.1 restriction endonuclease subunit S [Streptococcus sp. CF8_St5-13]MCP9039566.1 restriction endonuclease subunit S [Streptococcus sp. CF8_St5-11]